MFRSTNMKHSILAIIPVLKYDFRQFHVTTKLHIRRIMRGNISDSAQLEKAKNEFDKLVMPQNSTIDFFGLESDAGVITLGPPQNKLPPSMSQSKPKEKFHKASFGVIRYDTDNKLNYHGQYRNTTGFTFPHQNTDGMEVVKLSKCSIDYSKYNNKTISKSNESHAYKETEQDESYVDEYYFNNISEIKNTNHYNGEIHPPSEELNLIDENYFEKPLQSHKESHTFKETEQDESYIDEHYFSNISERENTNHCNDNIHPSVEELNFIDKNYFEKSPENHVSVKEITNYNDIQTSSDLNFIDKSNFETRKTSLKEIATKREHSNKDSHSVQQLIFSNKNYFKNVISENQNVSVTHEISKQNDDESFSSNLKSDVTESHMLQDCIDYNEPTSNFSSHTKNKQNFMEHNVENNQYGSASKKVSEQKFQQAFAECENPGSSGILKSNPISKKKQFTFQVVNESESKCSGDDVETDDMSTAYDFVKKLRKEQEIPQQHNKKEDASDIAKFDSKGFRILKNQVDDLTRFTRDEILNLIKQNVVYSDDDLLVLNKPYGLIIHESRTTKYPCLSSFLNDLAQDLDKKTTNPKLYTVHRLDKETTGCLLLARNETMAQYLKSLFAQRKIIKTYWIITSRVPDPREGIIDIPISEGCINNRKRMVLHPKLPKDIAYRNHSQKGKEAITSYKVISEVGNAALVEVFPKTGIKHQIRVHFGFGLSCPILGDHKYSHLDKLAPQKLQSDILQRLKVRQSKVRYIPMHIHAKSVTIPHYFEDKDLFVNIPIPNHMKENLKRLKFKKN